MCLARLCQTGYKSESLEFGQDLRKANLRQDMARRRQTPYNLGQSQMEAGNSDLTHYFQHGTSDPRIILDNTKIITILTCSRTRILRINLNNTSARRTDRNPNESLIRASFRLAQTILIVILDLITPRISSNIRNAEELTWCTPANSLDGEFVTVVDLTCCVAARICFGEYRVAAFVDYGKVTTVTVLVAGVGVRDGGEVTFTLDDAEMFS
ncbi:hypothetical protein FMEXI_7018 [Fusarium mexicanum]|uniref:Uncharacterized protein n=1 Tax=Fusarium mexicanum TaxID=751941 RepID=A0A8H5IV61_9HYPO|nr:hypothetical protein FMEXI_7018 [Fusarium mexicanum]